MCRRSGQESTPSQLWLRSVMCAGRNMVDMVDMVGLWVGQGAGGRWGWLATRRRPQSPTQFAQNYGHGQRAGVAVEKSCTSQTAPGRIGADACLPPGPPGESFHSPQRFRCTRTTCWIAPLGSVAGTTSHCGMSRRAGRPRGEPQQRAALVEMGSEASEEREERARRCSGIVALGRRPGWLPCQTPGRRLRLP